MSAVEQFDRALTFLERWRERDPALRMAEVYAPGPGWIIGMGLYFELAECLFRISEPSVREAKMGWWAEEVSCYTQDQARHPLTLAMHAKAVPAQTLRAMVFGAAALLDAPAAESRTHLQQQRNAMLQAFAELLPELSGQERGATADADLLTALSLLDDCFRVYSLGRQKSEPSPSLSLAEHAEIGLSRSEIAALPAQQLQALRKRLTRTWQLPESQSSAALAAYLSLWVPALRRRGAEPTVGALAAIRAWRGARRGRIAIDR